MANTCSMRNMPIGQYHDTKNPARHHQSTNQNPYTNTNGYLTIDVDRVASAINQNTIYMCSRCTYIVIVYTWRRYTSTVSINLFKIDYLIRLYNTIYARMNDCFLFFFSIFVYDQKCYSAALTYTIYFHLPSRLLLLFMQTRTVHILHGHIHIGTHGIVDHTQR